MTIRRCIGAVFLTVLGAAASTAQHVEPWQVWSDPSALSRVPARYRTVMSSSVCPNGSAYDRHSAEGFRFLRMDHGEGVIFEHNGPGVITRIWMTQGDGISRDLDPQIRLRVRLDGAERPTIDLSAADLFTGTVAPFLHPMVLDRRHAGGGNVSYVPIPFSRRCQISLAGAEKQKIWFQVTAMVQQPGITETTMEVDGPARWRHILGLEGGDPWPSDGGWPTTSGKLELAPGERWRIAEAEGPGQIAGLKLVVPRQRWPAVTLHLIFDDQETVSLPLPWFFAVSSPDCQTMRSLLVDVHQNELSSWFPMPYSTNAAVDLELSADSSRQLELEFAVRWSNRAPLADAGVLHAEAIDIRQPNESPTARLVDLTGPVRLVGLAVTAGADSADGGWTFLEGDETITVDGVVHWQGTGVEDFFNGGFYFRNERGFAEPVQTALSGLTCVRGTSSQPTASMYRLMPTDGPIAQDRLTFDWEGGRTGELPVRWRGVVWYYKR